LGWLCSSRFRAPT